jgi:endonuclease YncB( thermonuclease family)
MIRKVIIISILLVTVVLSACDKDNYSEKAQMLENLKNSSQGQSNQVIKKKGVVKEASDINNITVNVDGKDEKVNLGGIDIPNDKSITKEANNYIKANLIPGMEVELEYIEDKVSQDKQKIEDKIDVNTSKGINATSNTIKEHSGEVQAIGKKVAYIYIKHVLFNGGLVEKGLATVLTTKDLEKSFPETTAKLKGYEDEAKKRGEGIWKEELSKIKSSTGQAVSKGSEKVGGVFQNGATKTGELIKNEFKKIKEKQE